MQLEKLLRPKPSRTRKATDKFEVDSGTHKQVADYIDLKYHAYIVKYLAWRVEILQMIEKLCREEAVVIDLRAKLEPGRGPGWKDEVEAKLKMT